MVRRKSSHWVELLDGPCAGKRAIAQPDEHGCFEVEAYEGNGLGAVRTLPVYRMERNEWIGRRLRRTARWGRPIRCRLKRNLRHLSDYGCNHARSSDWELFAALGNQHRGRLTVHVEIALMGLLLQGGASAVQDSRPQDRVAEATVDLTSLSLDELISTLPPVGAETVQQGENWVLKPAVTEMKRRLDGGQTLTASQWQTALLRVGVLRHRARWPVERPFAVSMRETCWLSNSQIRLRPRRPGLHAPSVGETLSSTCGTYMMMQTQSWMYQELGPLPLGPQHLEFDVEIERGSSFIFFGSDTGPPPGMLWVGELALDTEIVKSVDDAIPPATSPELDKAVRESLSVAFSTWADGRTAILVVDPIVGESSPLARVGLSLSIELVHDGTVVQTLQLIPSTYDPLAGANSVHEERNQPIAFCAVDAIPTALENDTAARGSWSVRVKGTNQDVWSLWSADRRWEGQFTAPMDELIVREQKLAPGGRGPWIWMPSWR